MKMVICGVCLGLLGAVCSAAGPFDGKWTAHVMRPAPAGPQDLTITLNTSEGKVTGSIAIQGGGQSPIDWGMVKGDRIAFGRRPEDLTIGQLVEFTGIRGK